MIGGLLLILCPGKLSEAHSAWLAGGVLELRGASRNRLNGIVRAGEVTEDDIVWLGEIVKRGRHG